MLQLTAGLSWDLTYRAKCYRVSDYYMGTSLLVGENTLGIHSGTDEFLSTKPD